MLQTAGMPVTQWEYHELLRLDCNPLGPSAEEWRRELHDRSAGMVRLFTPVFAQLIYAFVSSRSTAQDPSVP